ncbi:hypothetical protein WICPIJ_001936 [Wickerhamomyces pijperi]|uniref:UBZ4-type domain-containing protein n=1 Tax=Wickerhamomyces pijperi TaxID=599730 RepID=A0A9P8QCL2_WICPI|nr:hypothetical protein WICPIJ_001936 [Wickerhamomyces pijperi]
MVSCPVCGKSVNINDINTHLDTCTGDKDEPLVEPKSDTNISTMSKKRTYSSSSNGILNLMTKKQRPNEVIEIDDDEDEEDEELAAKEANSSSTSIGSILSGSQPKTKPVVAHRAASNTTSTQSDRPHQQQQHKATPTPAPPSVPLPPQTDELKILTAQLQTPLAELLRPTTLQEYVGQQHLLGPQGILTSLIKNDQIPSMILWGTPGIGKTTLAKIISKYTKARFVEVNATNSGIADLKKIFEVCDKERFLTKRKTILFCDEIHRFNKTQQDSFLSYVERGSITLIGATTENPSFQVNNALLSRCKVFKLEKLSSDEIRQVIHRGIAKVNKFRKVVHNLPLLNFSKEGGDYLGALCNGDSRIVLNFLELINSYYQGSTKTPTGKLGKAELMPILQKTYLSYDKSGDFHYDTISAFHKSIRGSDVDASLYYLAKMIYSGGENPLYVARRLIRIASEDIGLADESCLAFAIATYEAIMKIGMPECELALVQCTVKFARAAKSVEIYRGWGKLKAMFDSDPSFAGAEVPLHLRNAPTKLMEELGYKKGYKYNPDFKDGKVKQDYLPESVKGLKVLDGRALGEQIDYDL